MTRLPNTKYLDTPRIDHGRRARTLGVVIHTIEGSAGSAINFFRKDSPQGVGAHVVIGTKDVTQLCDLDAICFHAKGANSDWVGLEHEGRASYTRAHWLLLTLRKQLRLSANRTAWVCFHYNLGAPVHGRNVKGHVDFPAGGHTDPGKGWPWGFYMWLCNRAYKKLVNSYGKSWS